jgi:hypothetical protein
VPETGPHLQVAAFCERSLQEADGVLSLIRLIDRVTHVATGPDVPDEMPPVTINTTLVVVLKADRARGRHTLRIRPEDPAGMRLPALEVQVLLEGEERGVQLVQPLAFEARREGLYWFDVLLDDTLLTRMPLRVVYQPQRTGAPPGARD